MITWWWLVKITQILKIAKRFVSDFDLLILSSLFYVIQARCDLLHSGKLIIRREFKYVF